MPLWRLLEGFFKTGKMVGFVLLEGAGQTFAGLGLFMLASKECGFKSMGLGRLCFGLWLCA